MALRIATLLLAASWAAAGAAQTAPAASPAPAQTPAQPPAQTSAQTSAQTLERVAIGQVVSTPPELKVYLDVRGVGDAPIDALPPESLHAFIDGKPLPVNSLKPFSATQEGIAYVFLVDVSASESHASFQKVEQALADFIDRLGPADVAAIITFGEDVHEVVTYTGDKAALKQAVSGLTNAAKMTHLNAAIVEGLRLAQKTDAHLPTRRAIVVLSDGKDEGSGLTTDDVLRNFEDNRVPVYAIGSSTLPGSQRAEYLEVLHRYANLSGGAYYPVADAGVGSAYTQVHDRAARVWVASLNCSTCAADGNKHPLQVRFTVQGQTLGDKIDVTLLPGPPPAPVTGPAAGPTAGPAAEPQKPLPLWKRYSWHSYWKQYAGAGVGLVALIGLAVWLLLRRRKSALAAARAPDPLQSFEDAPTGPVFTPYTFSEPGAEPDSVGNRDYPDTYPDTYPQPKPEAYPETYPETRPDNRPGIRIELVRKEVRPDLPRNYAGKLVDQIVVGRAQGSAIRIPDSEISGQHCRIEMINGHVLISDLGSTFGTSVNGIPLRARQKIESGDSISLGKVEFRIRINP